MSDSPSVLRKESSQARSKGHVVTKILDEIMIVTKRLEDPEAAYVCDYDLKRIWEDESIIRAVVDPICLSSIEIRHIQENMLIILSTLVWIGAYACLSDFTHRLFTIYGEPHFVDGDVPLKKEQLYFLDSEPALQDRFYDNQFRFKPARIILPLAGITQQLHQKARLPFETRMEDVGTGGYGDVDCVGISPRYFKEASGWESPWVQLVACKKVKFHKDFNQEKENLQILKESLTSHDRIMKHLTTIEHGPNRYILFPYALYGDLEAFLHCGKPPLRPQMYDFSIQFSRLESIDATFPLLAECRALAHALDFLHKAIFVEKTSTTVFCEHMDLKPANILIRRGDGPVRSPVGQWVITDFGISVIKKDTHELDDKVVSIGDYYSQVTMNTRPTRQAGTYQAPEVTIASGSFGQRTRLTPEQRGIGRKSDIWSIGCILSEVLAFSVGKDGLVRKFQAARTKGHRDDYFYVEFGQHLTATDMPKRYEIRKSVVSWLQDLCHNTANPQRWVDCYVGTIMKILVVDTKDRPDASELFALLQHLSSHVKGSPGSVPIRCSILNPGDTVVQNAARVKAGLPLGMAANIDRRNPSDRTPSQPPPTIPRTMTPLPPYSSPPMPPPSTPPHPENLHGSELHAAQWNNISETRIPRKPIQPRSPEANQFSATPPPGIRCITTDEVEISLSSKSSIVSIIGEAIEQFARIIVSEGDLKDKYETAVSRYTEERFLRNHKRLLKRYFLDLTAEIETDTQRHVVRALRGSLQRGHVSSKVYTSFSQRDIAGQEGMRALSAQEIDGAEKVNSYLQSLPKDSPSDAGAHGDVVLNTKDQDDARSQSSLSDSENEDSVKESEALSLDELKKIVAFLTRGPSFQLFKENLHQFVYPPSTIREALATNDIRVLEKVLTKNFDKAIQDEYSWLREIQAIGCSSRDIAELLFEHTNDTPWILFEPKPTSGSKIKCGFHRPTCAHSSGQNTAGRQAHSENQPEASDYSSSTRVIETESFLRSIHESCGLAGIVPISRDQRMWRGRVSFQDNNSTSYVSYGSTGEEEVGERNLVFCIYQALQGLCEAVSYVQEGACCCDCYTILRITTRDCLPDVIDMARVHFELVIQLEYEMQRLSLSDDIDHLQCTRCGTIAGEILSILGVPCDSGEKRVEHKAESWDGDQIDEMLHRCSLAVQFLCLSFLSYSQAHCGTIQPFFLDTPQRKVVLRGSKMDAADSWQIETHLVHLTCIGKMIQDPVVVFSASKKSIIQLDPPEGLAFDLMACPEDLIDTWGPGEFIGRISETGDNVLCAIGIGGGIIQAAGTEDKKFHWSRDALHGTSDALPIEPNMKLLIGATVQVNNNCPFDATQFCLNSEEQLENLGTFEGYWETAERQVGIQTGQYINLAILQTWEKIPTRTMKKTQLALPDNHLLPFLQSSWGLQFSCCTGIARRVSLCELIADVMPAFVESLLPIPRLWESLKKDHNIIGAFQHDDLQTWLGNISEECQQLVACIIRYILSVMAHTGVDSKGTNFTVAWVRKNNPFQCFKLDCQKKNYWTRILADSGDCATFAYIGSKCLVTSILECRGSVSMWRNESALLETAVCRHKPNLPLTPWILQHQDCYSMGRPDALLLVRVDIGESHANPRLLAYPSTMPTAFAFRLRSKSMQKLQRLRERQSKNGQAQSVVVLSAT